MDDFNTIDKPEFEANNKNGLQEAVNGTWSCTATASPFGSDPSDEMFSEADLSAVLAIPAPSLLSIADSIGGDDSTCVTEMGKLWQDPGLIEAFIGLGACKPTTIDRVNKTATIDYPSCDATADLNTACTCEFVFQLGNVMPS